MYIKEYTEKEEWEKDIPKQYDGHLFGRGQEHSQAPEGETEETEAKQPSPPTGGLQQAFSRLLENFPFRGLFSSEILLTVFAVWLLCNDREDDDYLFVILLFFLLR